MSIFRLLPLSIVIAAGAATLTAQSAPEKIPAAIPSADSVPMNSPGTDLVPQLSQFSVPRILRSQPEQENAFCLKMRVYKVARDGPRSDSTHAAGYSTCQPAARFQTRTVEYRVPSPTP